MSQLSRCNFLETPQMTTNLHKLFSRLEFKSLTVNICVMFDLLEVRTDQIFFRVDGRLSCSVCNVHIEFVGAGVWMEFPVRVDDLEYIPHPLAGPPSSL